MCFASCADNSARSGATRAAKQHPSGRLRRCPSGSAYSQNRARRVVRVFRVERVERGSLETHHGTSFKSTLGRGELHHGRHAPRRRRLRLLLRRLIGNETPDRSSGGNTIMTAEVHNSYAKQVRGLVRGKNNSPSANYNFSEILPRTEPRRRLSARAFAVERPINNNFKIKPSHVLYMEKVKARCIRRALTFV